MKLTAFKPRKKTAMTRVFFGSSGNRITNSGGLKIEKSNEQNERQ